MPTREDIKQWLKKTGKDRFWLASKMFVSKRQIDNWLSSNRGIPEVKLQFIESLMKGEDHMNGDSIEEAVNQGNRVIDDVSCVAFIVPESEKRKAEHAARLAGKSLEQFAMDAMRELANRILEEDK